MALRAEGCLSREIAAVLFVEKRTVDFHIRNVYRKLGVHTSLAAIRALEGLPREGGGSAAGGGAPPR